MKDEWRERIAKLEVLLERSSKEKDDMRQEILKLTGEVSELRVKVDFLQKENDTLASNKRKARTTRTTTKTK